MQRVRQIRTQKKVRYATRQADSHSLIETECLAAAVNVQVGKILIYEESMHGAVQ